MCKNKYISTQTLIENREYTEFILKWHHLFLFADASSGGLTVFDIGTSAELENLEIANDNHCFGCTAGMGSS